MTEQLKGMETKISRSDEEILRDILSENGIEYPRVYMINFERRVLVEAMTAAREDERERMRLMITNEIFFLSDMADSKDRWAANRLNKLLKQLTPCT